MKKFNLVAFLDISVYEGIDMLHFLPLANEVWGKVMFLHVPVITGHMTSFQGGLPTGGLHPGGGICLQGLGQTPLSELEKRAVRILLEYFLVSE